MKLVNRILEENELYKVVITSKDTYKENAKLIADCTDKTIPIAIRQVKMAMAELLQVTPEIKMIAKDELKIYQPKISFDLVEVYDELLQVFVQNLVITQSYKQARENSVLFLKKKYRLEDMSQAK